MAAVGLWWPGGCGTRLISFTTELLVFAAALLVARLIILFTRRYFPTLLIVLLAVFNDGAMIALSKDRVVASRMPNSWHLGAIFGQGMPCKSVF